MIIPASLTKANDKLYEPAGLIYKSLKVYDEGKKYDSCSFKFGNKKILFRLGNITPKKIGQFVTLWQRRNDVIQPYDVSDNIDFVIIHVLTDDQAGQFIFPKHILVDKNIFSINNIGGKLSFRVYPPWSNPVNKQAIKTSKWQMEYYVKIPMRPNIRTIKRVHELLI